ncbi:MAG: bifunctional folylpolyglutamate synthase/dihydrofolate synthase [Streptomycetales bacterium]
MEPNGQPTHAEPTQPTQPARPAQADFPAVEAALLARWPESRLEPSLRRIAALADLLGWPQRAYPVIHISGTNGKTSTARMIDTLLRGFGLRAGRFTSPHLESVTERITIDGAAVTPERFVEIYRDVAPYVEMVDRGRGEGPAMSFFEVLTGMAFAAFADAPVDAAVLEVGMGGSWDATNVADAAVAVITQVAVDHVHYLGETRAKIAEEKAGILKEGTLAILAQQPVEVAEVLLRRSVEVGATVAREGLEFGVLERTVGVGGQALTLQGLGGVYDDILLPLHGAHQAHNAACALAAVEVFLGRQRERLDLDTVRRAFEQVSSPGRLEVARRGPAILLDSAHNPAGAAATAAAIEEAFRFTRLVGVVGVPADKDAAGILEALEPVLSSVVVTQSSSGRALPAYELAAVAEEVFSPGRVEVQPRLDDALDAAVRLAEEEGELGGGVLVTGSIITVGDARRLLGGPR